MIWIVHPTPHVFSCGPTESSEVASGMHHYALCPYSGALRVTTVGWGSDAGCALVCLAFRTADLAGIKPRAWAHVTDPASAVCATRRLAPR